MFGHGLEFSIQIISRTLKFFANNSELLTLDPLGIETLGLSTLASSMTWMFASIHVALSGMIIAQAAQGIYEWLGLPGFIAATMAVLFFGMTMASTLIEESISVEEVNQVFAMYTSLFMDALLIANLFKLIGDAKKGVHGIGKLVGWSLAHLHY
ncbi:MAG: hypothetical protein D6732_27385 [Methanobacteriota archaeon]|nr:MAG: hypothetical protein D6732_27385 [Euryarchaeota archaeon]